MGERGENISQVDQQQAKVETSQVGWPAEKESRAGLQQKARSAITAAGYTIDTAVPPYKSFRDMDRFFI